jgi:hypothetical protein
VFHQYPEGYTRYRIYELIVYLVLGTFLGGYSRGRGGSTMPLLLEAALAAGASVYVILSPRLERQRTQQGTGVIDWAAEEGHFGPLLGRMAVALLITFLIGLDLGLFARPA